MSDIDYGCNSTSPVGVIAVILDDAGRAKFIMDELDGLGFAIVPKEPTAEILEAGLQSSLDFMKESGVDGLSPFKDYPSPAETVKRAYRAMIATYG